ncbi:MAG: hypothetical protein KKE44_00905 [Proteobacteria bacterium]|nr:hypothetical protein [Pseudomonadota bacterium]MBU1581285.1 hypothetical protein [Pseudomonadota bacterium]MBU2452774.1 hypothetical protein [Pseudomonadota bacterium]MBU2627039.1 hypothetical protein [Pseudomonadota bacterium]
MKIKKLDVKIITLPIFFLAIIVLTGFESLAFCASATGQELNSSPAKLSGRMKSIIKTHSEKLQKWVVDPVIIAGVNNQNQKNMPLDDIKKIDKEWLSGTNNDFALSLQTNSVGQFLQKKMQSNNMTAQLYVEAILCDRQGAVVGEYPKTTDYWQGDEDKFIKSYNGGDGHRFIGPLAFDDSTQTYSVQISIPVKDHKKTIGVLIVGLKNIK